MIYKIYDAFSIHAGKLRKHFDICQGDPKISNPERFAWDYWHVPDQYTFLRTPAFQYFPRPLYEKFHTQLVRWGRENLGCHDISPTWLSCYVEGCKQSLHRDQPHGPLAFVFSLTKTRKFSGGNTLILKSNSLNRLEKHQLFHSIPPKFNRLTVFDPALIHGVDEVRGVHDPRSARLVLHGWFINPRVFWTGGLKAQQVSRVMDDQLTPIFAEHNDVTGFCSWRLSIASTGRVKHVRLLADTLKGERAQVIRQLKTQFQLFKFPKGRASTLTLPLMFTD